MTSYKKICRSFKNTSGITVKDLRLEVEPPCELLSTGGFRNVNPYGTASKVFELGNRAGDVPVNEEIEICFKIPGTTKQFKVTPKWTTVDGESENKEDVPELASVLPADAKKAVRMAFAAIFDSSDESLKEAASAMLDKIDIYQC